MLKIIDNRSCECDREGVDKLGILSRDLKRIMYPVRRDIQGTAKRIMRHLCMDCPVRKELQASISEWLDELIRRRTENATVPISIRRPIVHP